MILAPDDTYCKTKGRLFVISGPSGVGKGTLVAAAIEALPNLSFSVSATTRPPRTDDIDGVTYHFLNETEFDDLINSDGMLEYAVVHGHKYGTPIQEVQKALEEGKDIILDIDSQGFQLVKERMPQVYSIFIAPPSLDALRWRLEKRASDSKEAIEQRLVAAGLELEQKDRYNKVIVNDDLDTAKQELIELIKQQRSQNEPAG